MPPVGALKDLEVTGLCNVPAGNYYYGNVNIFKKKGVTDGGTLSFNDATIDFWANSIIVENCRHLEGWKSPPTALLTYRHRFSQQRLTIHLWGAEAADPKNGSGVTCKTDPDELTATNAVLMLRLGDGVDEQQQRRCEKLHGG